MDFRKTLHTLMPAALISFGMVAKPAKADTITYTLASTVSGTLGPASFTNALVTVTLTGDTENVVAGPPPYSDTVVNSGNAQVSVSGLGTGTFTDPIVILSTLHDSILNTFFGGPTVLILDGTSDTGILLQQGAAFSTYDLRSAIGPISGPGGAASGSMMTPVFPTTAGNLTWAVGQPLGTSTFTAVVTTPEPGTLAFLGAGLAAMFVCRRLRCAIHR
jgi:hypothetical protein